MTVLVARTAAGFAAGIAGVALGSSRTGLWWLVLPVVAALVAGLALPMLLASISGRTIGYAPALIASAVGEALPVVIGLPHTRGVSVTVAVVLVGWTVSIVVMTWLVKAVSVPTAAEPATS
jgi:hypothetical protein